MRCNMPMPIGELKYITTATSRVHVRVGKCCRSASVLRRVIYNFFPVPVYHVHEHLGLHTTCGLMKMQSIMIPVACAEWIECSISHFT